jgi:hypothetical protein
MCSHMRTPLIFQINHLMQHRVPVYTSFYASTRDQWSSYFFVFGWRLNLRKPRTHARGPTSWPYGGAHLPPRGPFCLFFGSTDAAWPKMAICMTPSARSQRGCGKHKVNGSADCEDRKESLPESPTTGPSNPSTPSPSSSWWRGSSSTLDYEIVEVICINLSIVLHKLESHELPIIIVTIFLLTLWWIFCY